MKTFALMLLLATPAFAGGTLKGHAAIGGLGPVQRITIYNDGNTNWNKCELRLPNNKHYMMPRLQGHDQDGIMITRFTQDGAELDKKLDTITVKCAEGTAKFPFS
jgi:hypothetical protein